MTGDINLGSRGEATRQRILDTAERVFAELGYAAARLEDVAQQVGIKRASIVYYYRNKQALYEAVESRLFEALAAEIKGRLARITPEQPRLQVMADCWLDFMVKRPTAARLVTRNSADVYPAGSDPVRYSGGILTAWEQALTEAGGTDIAPEQLLCIIGGSILHYVCDANLLGSSRNYTPTDPQTLESFRALLHRTLNALTQPAAAQ